MYANVSHDGSCGRPMGAGATRIQPNGVSPRSPLQNIQSFHLDGSIRGESPKGTWLYSNVESILKNLYLPLPFKKWAHMVNRYVDAQGIKRISGGKDLKKSQHYPILFGRTVAEKYLELELEIKRSAN